MSRSTSTARRPLTPELLGDKGEALFEAICPDAGLVANKSTKDRKGWDYLLEFPYLESEATPSLDKKQHPIECKIQVKTIWSDVHHVDLTLSAARLLATAMGPAFIIVLPIVGHTEPFRCDDMLVFHMLDTNLARVLERLRKASAKNSLRINKATITYDTAHATRIPYSGACLARYINECCGPELDVYYAKKADQVKNLGFRFTDMLVPSP